MVVVSSCLLESEKNFEILLGILNTPAEFSGRLNTPSEFSGSLKSSILKFPKSSRAVGAFTLTENNIKKEKNFTLNTFFFVRIVSIIFIRLISIFNENAFKFGENCLIYELKWWIRYAHCKLRYISRTGPTLNLNVDFSVPTTEHRIWIRIIGCGA